MTEHFHDFDKLQQERVQDWKFEKEKLGKRHITFDLIWIFLLCVQIRRKYLFETSLA